MLSNAPWQLALKQGPHEQKGSLAAFAVGLDAGNVIGAYSTGDKSSTSVCIVIPDILGWRSPQNLRLCDELADATGWLVVCPDLHRGNVVDKWVADQALADIGAWLREHPAERVMKDIAGVADMLRERGAVTIAAVGISWGAAHAAAAMASSLVQFAALISPTEEALPLPAGQGCGKCIALTCALDEAISKECREALAVSGAVVIKGGGHCALTLSDKAYPDGARAKAQLMDALTTFLNKELSTG